MLDVALQFLRDELNTWLLARTGSDSVKVALSKVVEDTGKYAFDGQIGASLINIEEERAVKAQVPDYVYLNGQHVVREPELKLNLYVLFAANFRIYDDALKSLSHVLGFFQSHPVFTQDKYPALDSKIEKLTAELQSLGYEQLNQIWAYLGGKHLPSLVYKVRLVTIQPDTPYQIQPPLTKVGVRVHSE